MSRKSKSTADQSRLRKSAPAKRKLRNQKPTGPGLTGIVGIGASAGGLEACTRLLKALPLDTGLAFVLVQHLDPKHDSMLTDILSRSTSLPIQEVRQGMQLEPNHVYVIPPNTNLAILKDRLHLKPREEAQGQHFTIDSFFRSLAEDQKSRAIGVILSGTGTDGTLGLQAIKANGGLSLAQDEKSAKYTGMPGHAVTAGAVDIVSSPEGIARELARIGRHPFLVPSLKAETLEILSEVDDHSQRIFSLLRGATGVDFSHYKPTTIQRRIARRMVLHKISNLGRYVRYLEDAPAEKDALYQDLLINVTGFFREPETFEALQKKVFPRLMKDRPPQTPFRVWVSGCSTGEEAYSIAICLSEYLNLNKIAVPVQVFATDVSETVIEKARTGIYPENLLTGVSPERLHRFFVKGDGGYQVSRTIRDLCVFARQDLTKDPPFSRMDLITCRNLLIYLNPAIQQRIIPTFHYALKPNGVLVLGASETVGQFGDLFALLDKSQKVYTRKAALHRLRFEFPAGRVASPKAEGGKTGLSAGGLGFDVQKEADRIVLARFAPASVVVNDSLEILHFRGKTGDYLEPASGTASLNLLKMAREGLLAGLQSALKEARAQNLPARQTGLKVKSNGGFKRVSLEVIPIKSTPNNRDRCFLVLFEDASAADAPAPAKAAAALPETSETRHRSLVSQVARLHQELAATRGHLQSIIEEREATNEELQSANEEIESSNEELQSTNEELETAKEEMQSTNEELTTLNEELQNRNAELNLVNSDLINLLNSVDIPIVILGSDLRIRRFTPTAEKVLKLIPTDVGRPFTDLRTNVLVPNLEQLILDALDRLTVKELEVQDREGRWHALRIRPYKNVENKIDGVVIALWDIDVVRRSAAEIQHARDYAAAITDSVTEPLLILEADLRVKQANRAFYRTFRTKPEDTENRFVYSLGNGAWKIPRLRPFLEALLPGGRRIEECEIQFTDLRPKRFRFNACSLPAGPGPGRFILLTLQELA